MKKYSIASFYKFVKLTNITVLKQSLLNLCKENSIFGTIILAEEGINGTIAGNLDSIKTVITYLQQVTNSNFECKYAASEVIPFQKLKILIKKEIVTLGVAEIYPEQKTGIQIPPEDWNALISEPDIFLIDTRNAYEVDMGTFKGAVNPLTESFGEFPNYVKTNLDPKKHKKVAMFCTGGIRCEKASAYLLDQGFESVYQLEGGILKYLNQISAEKSLWEGQCFVFDERISVT